MSGVENNIESYNNYSLFFVDQLYKENQSLILFYLSNEILYISFYLLRIYQINFISNIQNDRL